MAHIETQCLHEGYKPGNGQPKALPIYQSTTYTYDSTDHIGQLFDLTADGHMYSRISNPTVACVEEKIAAMEGGVGALCTTSGQAASLLSILNIAKAGDHFISASTIYGGTVNLFAVTLKKFGIECTFVDAGAPEEELQKAFRPNTKAVFGETIANPAIAVFDIEKFAKLAHANGVPLIVDNTFATPVLCRPFEWGADIVVHSTTKYMDGHAMTVGGCIVDSGNFDWEAQHDKYKGLTEPDDSYHGVVYTKQFGRMAYIMKATAQLMRDLGSIQSPQNAFLINVGLETLHLRMPKHCGNALKVARYLQAREDVAWVNYPGLPGDRYYELAKKYMPDGTCGVISFGLKGGRKAAAEFMDKLKMCSIETHVADSRTAVLHPASHTHRQLNDEQLVEAGVDPSMIRFSCGIEDAADIIEDIRQALED